MKNLARCDFSAMLGTACLFLMMGAKGNGVRRMQNCATSEQFCS